ncbi:MAG TPA: copper resistance protein CopC [Streptomyces sp.]|nr:copper resistance protein CopC [Streptomyces sp.]
MTTAVPRTALRLPPLARAALLAALTAAFGLLGLFGGAVPATAHAALLGSSPARGAVVEEAPREVTLTFTESVALSGDSIRVLAPDGERVDDGAPAKRSGGKPDGKSGGEGHRYGVGLRDGLADGTYTVAWQAISADSHPVGGAFTFSVGAPSQTSATVSRNVPGGGLVGGLYDLTRYASYTGYLLLFGGSAFVLACWPGGARVRPVQRLVVAGWITLTAATIAALLLRGPYTGLGGLGDAFDTGVIREVLHTGTGTALTSRLMLLAVAALFVSALLGLYARQRTDGTDGTGDPDGDPRARRDQRDLAVGLAVGGTVVAVGIAATWATAEHASTGIQTGVAMPVDIAHLLAAAVWLGGLAALLTALWRGPAVPREAVRRFSRIALGSVVVLVLTGLYQSWRQVGTWSALFSTPFGRLLLLKAGLVTLLLGIAWSSRRWTARLADPGRSAAPEGARQTVEDGASVPAGAPTAPAEQHEPDDHHDREGQHGRDGRTGSAAGLTPERAAQLARQRAAVAAARRRRRRDADPVRTGLRRSVLAEAAVAAAVLAVATLLTTTEPARTAEIAARTGAAAARAHTGPVSLTVPFDTGGPRGSGTARLQLDPGRSGDNTLHLRITDPAGHPMDVPEVKVSLTLGSKDIGPLTVPLNQVGKGHWTASGLQLPLPGTWKTSVTVRTSDIDQVTERRTVGIR